MGQHAATATATSVPANVAQEEVAGALVEAMDVDASTTSAQSQGKRKASEEPEVDGSTSKKVRMGKTSSYHYWLFRVIGIG